MKKRYTYKKTMLRQCLNILGNLSNVGVENDEFEDGGIFIWLIYIG